MLKPGMWLRQLDNIQQKTDWDTIMLKMDCEH